MMHRVKGFAFLLAGLIAVAGVLPAPGRAAGISGTPTPSSSAEAEARAMREASRLALTPPAAWTPSSASATRVPPAGTPVPAAHAAVPRPSPSPLTLYFLEVGNADAIVITTPGGRCILIDAASGKRAGSQVLSFLMDKGIERLDTVVMSHADADHIGGMPVIFDAPFLIGEFLDPGYPHTTKLYEQVLEAVQARKGTRYRNVKAGDVLDWGPGLLVRVVSPSEHPGGTNESSIVIQIHHGNVAFLLTGDAEKRAEREMVERSGKGLRSQVLKVGHHGSKSSSTQAFLEAVKPEVAIVSTKSTDPDGPYEEPIDRLREEGAKVYQTGIYGMITVVSDGKSYRVLTEKSPDKPGPGPPAASAPAPPAASAPGSPTASAPAPPAAIAPPAVPPPAGPTAIPVVWH